MIDLSGVSKGFMQKDGRKFGAIENVTFSIRKGEFLSLLGPSGCGKSTLLNLIAGLEQADSGEISMQGKKSTVRRPTARLFSRNTPCFRG